MVSVFLGILIGVGATSITFLLVDAYMEGKTKVTINRQQIKEFNDHSRYIEQIFKENTDGMTYYDFKVARDSDRYIRHIFKIPWNEEG